VDEKEMLEEEDEIRNDLFVWSLKKNERRTQERCTFSNSNSYQYMCMYKSLNEGTGKGVTFSPEHGQTTSFEFPALISFDKSKKITKNKACLLTGFKNLKDAREKSTFLKFNHPPIL
jgi:hypothetical protein